MRIGWTGLSILFASLASAQTTIQVASVTAAPGASVPVSISLGAAASQVVALQWDVVMPPQSTLVNTQSGSAADSAGKTLSCNGTRCVLYGMNANAIAAGPIATLNVGLSAGASGA